VSDIDEATDPAALIEAYYDAGWTDGLPVVPPSDAAIAATLAAAGLEGPELLGEIPGRNTEVIAEKAAINAVMAGCRPEYMPVVVAAVRSLCAPAFAYHGRPAAPAARPWCWWSTGRSCRGSASTAATTPSARAIARTPRSGARCGSS